ncbi:MAG: histidinol-phosphate transaminase, partial [Muribaculaceae bacterium]|nr:histidinol-phosphate transaminase [Muribaculaceae bacterium]
AALNNLPLVKEVFPSDANFILARFDDPDEIYDYLSGGGVLVRNRNRVAGCEGCLRITVGTPAENTLLLKLLTEWK